MNKNIPEELLPLIDWWEKNGKQTIITVVIAAAAIGGYYGFKSYRDNERIQASNILMSAYTAGELEDGVAKYESSKAGPAISLRLAKKYFDDERYQEALDIYQGLVGKTTNGFEDIPVVGIAQCLEAMGKYDEAIAAYDAFANENPKSYLVLTAKLGAARTIAAKGDKKAALEKLESLKAEVKDDQVALTRVETTIDIVTRWEKREAKTLLDAANAAANELEKEVAKPQETPAQK